MEQNACPLRQHLAAVLTLVVLFVAGVGLVSLAGASVNTTFALETPLASDWGGIQAPVHAEWGHAVLAIGGLD